MVVHLYTICQFVTNPHTFMLHFQKGIHLWKQQIKHGNIYIDKNNI